MIRPRLTHGAAPHPGKEHLGVFVVIPAMVIFRLPHASILLDLLAVRAVAKCWRRSPRVENQTAG